MRGVLGIVFLTLVASLGAMTAGCSDNRTSRDKSNAIDLTATEYAYDASSDTADSGVITFNFKNAGGTVHEFAFGRLDSGHTVAELLALPGDGDPPGWAHDLGGLHPMTPGQSASLTRELPEAGTYFFICYLPSADGTPHAKLGMTKTITLGERSKAQLPKAELVITAENDKMTVPAIGAGRHVVELRNAADAPREFFILSVNEGHTPDEIDAWANSGFQGEAPALFPGGMQSIDPGASVFLESEWLAGRTYLVADFESNIQAEIIPK